VQMRELAPLPPGILGSARTAWGVRLDGRKDDIVRDPRNIVIAILAIAVAVLGYLYYDSQQHRISVNLPGFKLDAK